MMAHHNNYNSNPLDGHMYETNEEVEGGKLDCSATNFINNGLPMPASPMQMQPGFRQQQQQSFNDNMGFGYSNHGMAAGNQAMNFANLEAQSAMNFQQNSMGMGMGVGMSQQAPFMGHNTMGMMSMNHMHMNNFMNQGMMANNRNHMQFHSPTPMMNGAGFMGPFPPRGPASPQALTNLPPRQQLSSGAPTFAATSINCRMSPPTPKKNASLKSFANDSFDPKNHATSSTSSISSKSTEPKKGAERRVSLVASAGTASATSKSAGISMLSSPISKTKKLLPEDYEPTSTAVICGNKRKYFESKGNKRFRQVSKSFTREYAAAPTKIEKSAVVSKVMHILLEDCADGICFVSPKDGRWYAVSERTAREKIGTYLRDCLSGHYLSSAKNKIARRRSISKKDSSSLSGSAQKSQTDDDGIFAAPAPSSFAALAAADQDDGSSLGDSVSFYDVDDLTPVPL